MTSPAAVPGLPSMPLRADASDAQISERMYWLLCNDPNCRDIRVKAAHEYASAREAAALASRTGGEDLCGADGCDGRWRCAVCDRERPGVQLEGEQRAFTPHGQRSSRCRRI